ncbi:MAG: hypothetical protein R3F48_00790 [Candidatus Zixiibacteriota bacterium]
MKTAITLAILLICCTGVLMADIAPLLQYQGRLTDENGAPLADGSYSVTFSIYAGEGAPSPIWTSGARDVSVAGGLFTYILGSNVSLPNNIFDNQTRYLGITIGGDSELTPRSRFTATPYAYRALKADSADVLTDSDEFLHAEGDRLLGTLYFDGDNDGESEGRIIVGNFYSRIYLNHFSVLTVMLFGDSYGELLLRNGFDGRTRVELSAIDEGGRLDLNDSLGDARVNLFADQLGGILYLRDGTDDVSIRLDAGATADLSVMFPDKAINSDEIYDEPGISSDLLSDYVSITATSDLENIGTFQVTTPSHGYLKVTIRYFLRLGGTTGINGAFIQIDSVSGGSLTLPHYNFHYHNAYPSTGDHYEPAMLSRIFYLGGGSRPLYINARLATSASGTVDIGRIHITTEYYPTGYDAVKTLTDDPSGFDNATAVTITDDDGNTSTTYEVDLRELEMKVKQAQLEEREAILKRREAEFELERAHREIE